LKISFKNPIVECHRLAPLSSAARVDVVMDLMIHDIDVIASLVRSGVDRVEAVGVAVLTDKPDIANARITFSNGCIANVTASRVSIKRERKIRFFQPDAYLSIDYDQRRAQIFHKPPPGGGWMDIRAETIEIKEADALADEIDSFLDCARTRSLPLVSGAEGLRALEIASMMWTTVDPAESRFMASKQIMLVVGEASEIFMEPVWSGLSAIRTQRCDFLALGASN
jgi:predicted dehydrogenase